jgi:hypothetical protein
MNDKFTEITIMTLFSAVGVMILVLGWVRPLDGFERAIVTVIGGAGIIGTLVRLLLTRSQRKATAVAVTSGENIPR